MLRLAALLAVLALTAAAALPDSLPQITTAGSAYEVLEPMTGGFP
jgi:hypothetical protein